MVENFKIRLFIETKYTLAGELDSYANLAGSVNQINQTLQPEPQVMKLDW